MPASVAPRPHAFPEHDIRASHTDETPCGLSLADVIARLQADPDLHLSQQREMISALHTIARILNADPAAILAEPRYLRDSLNVFSPATAGFGWWRWNNVRSLMMAALQQVGVCILPGRAREPLAPVWEALRVQLPDARHGWDCRAS